MTNTQPTEPSHIVVDLGSHVLAGCREDDDERIKQILKAGFVPTEVPPGTAIKGWVYFRSTAQESE